MITIEGYEFKKEEIDNLNMITIEGYEFKKEEIDNLNETFFTATKDNQQYLVTRFNLKEMNLNPDLFKKDPFINYLNTFVNEKFRYFVYPLLKNKVVDYIDQMGNNNREKECYVQHIIRAIYNIHNSFRVDKTFLRFSLDSYYLLFSNFNDELCGNFKESKVKVIAGLSLYPTKAGTIMFLEPRKHEDFITKISEIDLAYQIHVRDLGTIATRLLPKNYQHHCSISNVCREFVAKCLQEETGQLLDYERIKDERFIKENYESFKNASYLASAQAEDPSLYINSDIKPSSSIKPISSMEPCLIKGKPSFLNEMNSSKPFSSLKNPHLQKRINNNKNHLFPIIKQKKMLELVYCFTYIDSTDSKKNEQTKKTIKEEAFEAADKLFDFLTLEGNLNIELFPIYDELYKDYNKANAIEKKSN